jgi:hypothetical protein
MYVTLAAAAIMGSAMAQPSGIASKAFPWDPTSGQTMNGQYHFGNQQTKNEMPTHRGTNYFEVISPSYFSTYAQVNWDAHTIPLDPGVVADLKGKLVNFVGYEFDMVRRLDNGTHVSVPAWELYNHHYGNSILGEGVKLVKDKRPLELDDTKMAEDAQSLFPGYRFVADTEATRNGGAREQAGQFSNGGLIIGNGDESRKTFHYFADGYGVLVESPQSAAMHPMIIDTKNREGGGTPQRPTGHGIIPNASTVPANQMYSPIHECPCTDKWHKHISSYSTLESGTCNPGITSAKVCFLAAAELGLRPVTANKTISNAKVPAGCSITATQGGYEIIYNTIAKAEVTCGKPADTPSGPPRTTTCNLTGTWMSVDTKNPGIFEFVDTGTDAYNISSRGKVVAVGKAIKPSRDAPQGTVSFNWGRGALSGDMLTYSGAGSPDCSQINWGNRVVFAKMPWAKEPQVPVAYPRVAGTTEDLVNVTVDIDSAKDTVTITLQGPSDVWFGAGFGYHHVSTGGADPSVGVSMVGTNWTVVCLGDGTIQERDLGNHEPGVQLPASVNVTSNTVVGKTRTVVMTRSVKGTKADDYHFDPTLNQLTFINAIGGGPYLQFHVAKASNVVYLIELDYPTCICDMAGDQGTIGGYSWGNQRCVAKPLGQMLDDPAWLTGPFANPVTQPDGSVTGVNPTCDIHAYRGGLRCCKGGTIILDDGQNVTNNDPFEWQLRFRYYYEVVEDPTKVKNTFMTSWWTEHNNGEHDVPVCLEKDKSKCQNTITSNFTAGVMGGCANGCEFVTMEGHCHIGCLGMEMWIVDDPQNPVLLCNASIGYGQGDGWMDEMGYIAGANTCVFGQKGNGVFAETIPLHPTTKLMSVKTSNNTNSFTGDMALWEINAAPLDADFKFPEELEPAVPNKVEIA